MRVVVDPDLGPAAAAVQSGHALTVLAAAFGAASDTWASTTLVLHAAPAAQLHRLVRAAGGTVGGSGHSSRAAWFSEPDLLWAPTALAFVDRLCPALSASVRALPLYRPHAAPGPPPARARSWLRRLAADAARAGLDGPALFAEAAAFGDPAELETRVVAASLYARGALPPPLRATPRHAQEGVRMS